MAAKKRKKPATKPSKATTPKTRKRTRSSKRTARNPKTPAAPTRRKPARKTPVVRPAKKPAAKPTPKPTKSQPKRSPRPARPAKRPPTRKRTPDRRALREINARVRELKNQRARERRAAERALEQARRDRRNLRARQRRAEQRLGGGGGGGRGGRGGRGGDTRPLEVQAEDWFRRIRDDMWPVVQTELSLTIAGGGAANLAADQSPEAAMRATGTPWFAVGRFDVLGNSEGEAEISYQDLAGAFAEVERDFVLEVAINPDRLSQIRIVFSDPGSNRGEGDSVVSRIGAWGFIVSDIITELVGGTASIDEPADGSLAARYQHSTVPHFYVFFSREIERYQTAPVFAFGGGGGGGGGTGAGGKKRPRTRTVKLRHDNGSGNRGVA